MPVSRRGFLRLVGTAESSPFSGAFLSARGLEAHFAESQAQGGRTRPVLPPGVDEIRLSSNENPFGPRQGGPRRDSRQVPRGGPLPVQQFPGRRRPRRHHRREIQGQARECRPRRGLAGDPQELHARLGVADARLHHGAADVRELHRLREALQPAADRSEGRFRDAPRRRADDRRGDRIQAGGRPGVLQQSEQPDRDRPRREDRDRHGRADPEGLARHGNPDRRGVSRVRHRSVVRDRDSARALDAQRLRRPHVLESVRDGGHAHRLRDRHGRYAQAAREAEDALQHQRVRRRRGDRLARRCEAHRGGARAEHRGAHLHGQGAAGHGREAGRLAGQLPVRGHRPAREGVPRRVRQVGRDGRARLPAVREDALPHFDRHDGRDEEGDRGLPRPR